MLDILHCLSAQYQMEPAPTSAQRGAANPEGWSAEIGGDQQEVRGG